MNKSESIAALAPDLIALQSEMKPVAKSSENPFFHSKYADLNSVWSSVQELLSKHNFAIVQTGSPTGPGTICVETMLIHKSGEWISGELALPLAKLDPQGAGSAITYARRYGLSAMLSLTTEEDDDGNRASQPQQRTYTPHAGPSGQAPAPAPPAGGAGISDAQKGLLLKLIKEREMDPELTCLQFADVLIDDLSKQQAIQLINNLMQTPAKVQIGSTSGDPATKPQLSALASIAGKAGVTIQNLIDQEFDSSTDETNLTKAQASQLIQTYGSK